MVLGVGSLARLAPKAHSAPHFDLLPALPPRDR